MKNETTVFGIQKLDFIICLYTLCIILSEVMGSKTFPLFSLGSFPLTASIGIFLVPLVYCINDTITEVYGKKRAQSMVRSGLLMIVFFLLFSLLAVHLPPSFLFASTEKSYDTIFSVSARIALSSLIAFALGEIADVLLFSRMKAKLGKKALWLRTNVANILSQFIDTTLFITLAFYALGKPLSFNAPFLLGIIIPYWILKCLMSFLETPFVYLGVKWLKK